MYNEFEEMQAKYYAKIKADKDEQLLDWFVKLQLGPNRSVLEELAIDWASPLGWSFSGPIRTPETSPSMMSMLFSYDALPSAGKDISQNSKGDLFEIEAPGGRFTTKYTRKTILNATRACAYSELKEFALFYFALKADNLLDTCLEQGYAICTCGYPIRTESASIEDRFCSHCDKLIPDFQKLEIYYDSESYGNDEEPEDEFCSAVLI